MGGLKIVDADFGAWDMRGDGQYRHARALGVVQAIDEMQIARPATAGTDREFAGDMGFTGGSEGGAFLMAHMNPVDFFLAPERVGKAVERVPDNTVNPFDPDFRECLRHIGRSRSCHPDFSPGRDPF